MMERPEGLVGLDDETPVPREVPPAVLNMVTHAVFKVSVGGTHIPAGTLCESNGQVAVLDDKGEPYPDGARVCLWLPKKFWPEGQSGDSIMVAVDRTKVEPANPKAALILAALR